MDRSESKLFGSFIPPSPSTSPFLSTSGKPSGLSRPRMVKVRRHLASAPVRAVSDAEPGPAFNPFRRGVKVSENPSGQNPNSDANVFVFGSGVKSDENPSTLSSDAFEPAKSDSVPFVFGASSVANFDAKSIGSQDVRGGSRDSDVFMFGSGVKKSSSLDAGLADKLSDKVWRLNLQDSGDKGSKGEVGGKNVDKNFSWGSSLGVDESSFSNEMMKLNMEASGNEQSKQEVYGNNVFIFGSSVNAAASVDGSTANKNSSCGSSFGNDDEKRKLNFGICGNVDGFDKAKEAYHSSKVDGSNSFIFGSTKSIPGSFGGGIEDDILCKSSTLKPSSSVDYDKAKLSEEVRKLNLHNSGSEDGSKDTRKNTRGSKVDGNNIFVFGSGNGAPCTSIGNSMDNPLEQSSDLGQHSSIGFDEGSSSKLPDELWKLNLQSSGNDNSFGHTKQAGNKVDGNNTFVFGSSKSTTSSFGSTAVNRLPDDMEKLNLGSGAVLQGTKEESTNFAAGVFVFGSNRKSAVSSQTSTASFTSCDKSRASVLPDGLQNFKTTESVNTNSLEKATDNHCNDKVDAGTDCYVSGGISSSLGGSAVSTSPDEIKKLHISNITENLMGSTDQVPPPGGLATNCACNPLNFTFQAGKQDTNVRMGAVPQSPLNFTFQAGKQDTNVRMGAVPQSQSHDFCMSTGIPTGSSLPSMQGSNFETSAADFTFTSIHLKSEAPHMEFKTLKQDASSWFNDNFFSRPHQNMEFGVKKGASKNTRTKKKRGKLRQSAPYQQSFAEHFTSRETGSQENPEPESPGGGSPMDYSPYQETLVADRYSPEASITINESTHLPSCSASTDVQTEDLASATQGSGTKEGDRKQGALKDDVNAHTHGSFTHESSFVSEKDSVLSKKENVGLKNDTTSAAKEAEHDLFSSDIDQQVDESGTSFTFASSIGDIGGSSFAFVAPSVHGRSSQSKRHYRRKDRVKACQALFRPTTDAKIPLASSPFPVAGISALQDPAQGLTGISSVPSSGSDSRRETNNEPEVKSKSIPTEIACVAAQETCEKWRLRGNQAYASGLLSKAEDYYTRGVNSVSPKETSKSCIHALMLCYSNRAATRMSLGRIREALSDCMMAAAIDPSFLKAQLRAGNCHLALGETQDAMKYFKNCLQLWNGTTIDQKISSEASEGLQKAQKVAGCMDESAALLLKRTSPDARKALEMVSESLSISPHSESLIEMKAEALLVLRSYEEVIQLCQQTLDSSERNFVITGCDGQLKDMDRSEGKEVSSCRLWRWRLISKSYFYLGKLEEALDLLQKHEQVQPLMKKYRSTPPISSAPLLVTIRELLRLKASGNEAFQAGRHMEAVEHYTSALACNTESRPFAAILFCNRAAAYQALGQITDAIADCSLAIALDGSYPKAISRRATLYDMIRDYGQASNDLHRLISLLEKHSEATDNNGLKRAHSRLSAVEEEAKKDIPLDMYMILGIEPSSSAADVKKAYRKAALKHHPDKAGQFITRSENIDDGLWKDIADEVHIDADRLFKMIGEAYTILSDPTKRLQYDAEEEMRTTLKKGYGGISTPRAPKATADSYSSPYDKSSNRHQWHDGWKSYGSSQQRSSEYSRSNRR